MCVCIHNEILLSYKNNEILPVATIWMDLEAIMLSEISQRQIQYELTYMWNLKTTHMTQHNTIKTDS